MSFDPYYLFEELTSKVDSLDQVNEFLAASQKYHYEQGDLNLLKIFIPNSNKKNPDNFSYLHPWNPDKALKASEALILVLKEKFLMDSYLREEAEDGYYLAFTMKVNAFIHPVKHLSHISIMLRKAKENNIRIPFLELEEIFSLEQHRSWYNRYRMARELMFIDEERYDESLVKATLYDGKQNWMEGRKYPKIEKWEPKGEFISVADDFMAYDTGTEKEVEEYRQKLLALYP